MEAALCVCAPVFKVCLLKGLKTWEKFLEETSPRPSSPAGGTGPALPLHCLSSSQEAPGLGGVRIPQAAMPPPQTLGLRGPSFCFAASKSCTG